MFHDEVAHGRAENSKLRHATEDAKIDDKEWGEGEAKGSRIDTAVDEFRSEMVHPVARCRFD